jgi:transposase
MTAEEENVSLRQEQNLLQEQLAQRDELIAHLQHELVLLREQVQALQEQLTKDSHNSHLPPSSDRFHRQPKSLRKSSGKKPGGQAGHPGRTLMLWPSPDTVILHPVDWCQHCQRDLREVESLALERRQVLDLPPKRIVVIEHQAEQKCCPRCQQVSLASFPLDVPAPVPYGAALGAVGVDLVRA